MSIIDDLQVLTGKKKSTEKTPTSSQTVLIVEDDKALSNILNDRLMGEGYKVIRAANGKEGLDMAMIHKPDVVLLDLMMPIMNGSSMLHKLRDIPEFKELPVIVLTNAGAVENVKYTQRYHDAVEFLIKSNVTMDEIVQKVKSIAW